MQSYSTHITQCIPGTSPASPASKGENVDKEEKKHSIEIKRIFFSKNEKFVVLITKTNAVVTKITPTKLEFVGEVDLPEIIDYNNCDHQTIRQLASVDPTVTRVDSLAGPAR